MNKQLILNLLGLATRARKIVVGEEFVLKGLSNNQHNIVFLASDAGDNIKRKILRKTEDNNVVLVDFFSSLELSKAIGKDNRRVVLVSDKGFIDKFKEYMNS